MSLRCALGYHDWDGCVCRRCGEQRTVFIKKCATCRASYPAQSRDHPCPLCAKRTSGTTSVEERERRPPRIGAKATCAKCDERMDTRGETFLCKACGQAVCWACVANAYVERHGWPPVPGDQRTAVMFTIMKLGAKGKAPCPLCGKMAAKRDA
jgi:hypothetical protein